MGLPPELGSETRAEPHEGLLMQSRSDQSEFDFRWEAVTPVVRCGVAVENDRRSA